jgi:hypothetical protein
LSARVCQKPIEGTNEMAHVVAHRCGVAGSLP